MPLTIGKFWFCGVNATAEVLTTQRSVLHMQFLRKIETAKIFQHMKKGSRLVVLSFLKLFFLIMKNGDTKSCTGYWFLSSSVGVSFGSAKSMWRPSNWALKRFGLHQLPDKMTAKGEPVDAVEDQKQEWHHHQEEPRNKIINSSVCTVKPNRNKFPLLTWKVTRTVFRCDLSQTFLLL